MDTSHKFRPSAYHFINPSRDNIEEYAEAVISLNGIICWDLEDIIPAREHRTKAAYLKTKNRNEVIEGIKKNLSSLNLTGTGTRLNSILWISYSLF